MTKRRTKRRTKCRTKRRTYRRKKTISKSKFKKKVKKIKGGVPTTTPSVEHPTGESMVCRKCNRRWDAAQWNAELATSKRVSHKPLGWKYITDTCDGNVISVARANAIDAAKALGSGVAVGGISAMAGATAPVAVGLGAVTTVAHKLAKRHKHNKLPPRPPPSEGETSGLLGDAAADDLSSDQGDTASTSAFSGLDPFRTKET